MTINTSDRRIWLASASPRRRQLLEQMGLDPVVRAADVPEVPEDGEGALAYARRLARQKGRAVRGDLREPPHWVLAADTVVVLDDDVIEKPGSAADAVRMLSALSGREHQVITAFWIGDVAGLVERTEAATTRVMFRGLDPAEIDAYVRTGEPLDKAGAYGIQGAAGVFVAGIVGCYFNVVGLPITRVALTLRELGAVRGMPF